MNSRSSVPIRVLALVVLLSGAALMYGGGELIMASGTVYYMSSGFALCVVAILLFARKRFGMQLYALFLALTLLWSVFEAGFDGWALWPRLDWWWAIGVLLLIPWFSRGISKRGAPVLLWASVLLMTATACWAFTLDAYPGVQLADVLHSSGADSSDDTIAVEPSAGDATDKPHANNDWPAYGRTQAGTSHSPLTQITPQNVSQLERAWTFHTGDLPRSDEAGNFAFEATPIKIGDSLYVCTPHSQVIALDAATGTLRWRYDPQLGQHKSLARLARTTCRGVSYYDSGTASAHDHVSVDAPNTTHAGTVCEQRIFAPIINGHLVALDALTGQPCPQFGNRGVIDLTAQIGHHFAGQYMTTSPPVVAHGLVIVNAAITDNDSNDKPSGVIRAFDAHTGRLVWNFDVSRPDDTAPLSAGQVYPRNTVNSWAVMSADPTLGLLYVPMGNEPPDLWGGQRSPSAEKFSASVVALDIDTGHLAWRYQTVHHDLWDQDLPAQLVLTDLATDEDTVPVVIAATKHGDIFVLDRRSGELVQPAPETRVPQGAVASDFTSATQPLPQISLRPPTLTGADMWGITPFDQLACRVRFKQARYEGPFTPPSTDGTVVNPGSFGIIDWNGISIDPQRQLLIAAPNHIAFYYRLIPRESGTQAAEQLNVRSATGTPYRMQIQPFLSRLGLPCQQPPWGQVAAVDLQTGHLRWQHRNGTIRDTAPVPLPIPMGVPSLGGMVTTASGLMFMAGTLDNVIRAYDTQTGRQLWQHRLPAGGQAKPAVFGVDGREYIVIASGGHQGLGTETGDAVTAYALPESGRSPATADIQ